MRRSLGGENNVTLGPPARPGSVWVRTRRCAAPMLGRARRAPVAPDGATLGSMPTSEDCLATVRYLVHDVDTCLPFYETLGFTLSERWGAPFAMLARGDLTLWLAGPGTSAQRPLADGRQPEPGSGNRLVIEVDDLDAALKALAPVGARFRSAPITGPGGRQVLVDDPAGNPIELFEGG